jgi:AraC-like DNA-binding protein/mannose-6-phosphate isomerase-like protein (cupin superfamily)
MPIAREGDGGAQRQEYAYPDHHFSFQLRSSHWRRVSAGWSYPVHHHALIELNAVLEGRQVLTCEGIEYAMRPGDIFLIQPSCVHECRAEGAEPMMYFSVHFDIDDTFLFERITSLGNTLYPADSAAARRLKPHFDRLMELSNAADGGGTDTQLAVRSELLNLMLTLALTAVSDPAGSDRPAGPRHDDMQRAVHALRERSLLEKKVLEVLSAPEGGAIPADPSHWPEHRWIGVVSVMISDRSFWAKPDRFFAKILLDEALQSLGVSVVVDGEQLLTGVFFSDEFAVPALEELAARTSKRLEQALNVPIRVGIGGVAPSAEKLRGLFHQSLRQLGIIDHAPGGFNFEFMNRSIRLALLTIEAEYASPELSLRRLAGRLGLTPNYLSALFTEVTGHPFKWHLTRIRIQRARKLLEQTDMKIQQIGRLVGYSDPAYFSRSFKSVVGASPAEYRARSAALQQRSDASP